MKRDDIGIVIIGRNEGERLRRCLQSVRGASVRIYVDSGSTDGSQDLARAQGFTVLDLDTREEFTAARARNLGFFHVAENYPGIEFVQAVDGDCEIVWDWVREARQRLVNDEMLAVVFGRRRERYPSRNIYHRACEIEWNIPAGPANSCGGDAMYRLASLIEVGGFNPRLIAGEEPELCYRLRRANWKILSDGQDMTLHDVDISGFRQWWRRALRAGYGFSELMAIHGRNADEAWRRLIYSGFFWTTLQLGACILFIVSALAGSSVLFGAALVISIIICLQVIRVGKRARANFDSMRTALHWSALLFVSKIAQAQGAILYWRRRLTSSRRAIIEYK